MNLIAPEIAGVFKTNVPAISNAIIAAVPPDDPLPGPITILITGLVLSIGCYLIGRYFTRKRKRVFLGRTAFVLMLLVSVATAVSTTWAVQRKRQRESRLQQTPELQPVRQWDDSSDDDDAPTKSAEPDEAG